MRAVKQILFIWSILAVTSCTIVPRYSIDSLQYCKRAPGTNLCQDYYDAQPDVCGPYDVAEECQDWD
jgi:hypothetical protein